MKVIVFGATGKTGKEILKQALAQGWEVTAFVRDPSMLNLGEWRFEYYERRYI